MHTLMKEHFGQVTGGQCTGGGNSNGASMSCTTTVYENKNTTVKLNLSGDTRRGVTGGGLTWQTKW